mgnify:CR=1 FL=1
MMILMTMDDEHAAILCKILQGLASLYRSGKQRVKIADDHHEKTEKGRLIGATRVLKEMDGTRMTTGGSGAESIGAEN